MFVRALILVALLTPSALPVASIAAGPADSTLGAKPNVLLIFLDNVGYGDLGCYGNRDVKTPNLDQLARDGARCTDFYTASPSCTPSRGALLTGRHPQRNGLTWQLTPKQNIEGHGLPLSERTIPQYLKPLGYATGAFGKWNLGFAAGARPTERGFDEFLGHASGNIHYYKHLYAKQNDLRRGTEPVDLRGHYSTDLFADAAIDFIGRHRQQPWFVYLPFNAAHFVSATNVEPGEPIEWQVPPQYLALYGSLPDERDQRVRFRAVLTALDDAIGRVLRAVDETGVRDRTLVLCISDNGAFMLSGRGLEVQSNGPLRDGGVTTYEGGVRVPAMVRWPGAIRPGTVASAMLSTLDVLPMILRACGGKLPSDRVLDGVDPTDALTGNPPPPNRALYWTWKQGKDEQWRGMRAGVWKLVRRSDVAAWELYDLAQDIAESKDHAARQPAVVQSMGAKFDEWMENVHNDPSRGHPQR